MVKNDSRVGGRKERVHQVKRKSIDINPLKAVFCYGLVTEEQGLVLSVAEMKHLEQVLECRMTFFAEIQRTFPHFITNLFIRRHLREVL